MTDISDLAYVIKELKKYIARVIRFIQEMM